MAKIGACEQFRESAEEVLERRIFLKSITVTEMLTPGDIFLKTAVCPHTLYPVLLHPQYT